MKAVDKFLSRPVVILVEETVQEGQTKRAHEFVRTPRSVRLVAAVHQLRDLYLPRERWRKDVIDAWDEVDEAIKEA